MNLKKIILIINISLAIMICWTCYLGFRTWQSNTHVQPPQTGTKETPLMPKNSEPLLSQKGPETFQDIINSDPFGTKKAESPAPVDVAIPSINLNDYELKGTIVGENADSFAIILHRATREQKLYYLKDRIQGATIAQIKTDQVAFDLGSGHMENLFMMLVKDTSLGPGFETFPKSMPLPPVAMPPLPRSITPQGNTDMNPPVIKNLRPKPVELKKRPLS